MTAFEIPHKLPSLNDYVKSCRENKYGANKTKATIELIITAHIKAAKLPRIEAPIIVHFTWFEATIRRDKDNVAFAKKFILDALQKSKIIPNDNSKFVAGFTDTFIYHKGQKVIVKLEETHNMVTRSQTRKDTLPDYLKSGGWVDISNNGGTRK